MPTVIIVSMLSPVAVCAATQLPADYTGPQRIDLSGTWDFRLDPHAEGEAAHWFAGNTADDWQQLAVPGSYNELLAKDPEVPAVADTMRFYKGAAWYRTTFDTPPSSAGTLTDLHLSGTVLRHTVWLNGNKVGSSLLPYLDATYEVTSLLRSGEKNTLVIEVDNSIEKLAIPDNYWHGWWDDGGLIRPVYLEQRPATHSQSYASTAMQPGGGWKLGIDTHVSRADPASIYSVLYVLTAADGTIVWRGAATQKHGAAFHTEVALPKVQAWSPEHPVLYTLTTSTSTAAKTVDVTAFRIGFRQIEVSGTKILLNGQQIWLRGVNRHQFLAGAGMSLSLAQDRKDIEDIKALGANFVRLAHYSQSQDVYDACDELGIMVWTEIPAWQSNKQSLADSAVWTNYAQPQLQQMVMQHRNHPSVVVWSVANEIPTEGPIGAAYVEKAIAYVKSLDTTRLVTFASDRRLADQAFGTVDVISLNEYFGWYYGDQNDVGPMLDAAHDRFPGKPIVVSEFGDEGIARWTPSQKTADGRDYSYDRQSSFLLSHLDQIFAPKRRPFVAGAIIWVYNDYPDPHQTKDRPTGGLYINNKGLVTMDRTHKPAYTAVQAFYQKLKAETVH